MKRNKIDIMTDDGYEILQGIGNYEPSDFMMVITTVLLSYCDAHELSAVKYVNKIMKVVKEYCGKHSSVSVHID